MNEKQRKNKKTVSSRAWSSVLIFMVVMLSFSITMDFIKDIKTNKNNYEIRYESSEEVNEDSADKTPFTQTNVKRIKAISILQLLFAVLPGMISFTMTMVRFSNSHGSFNIKWMYLLIISAITALIANVFQYGVKLQEDSDSIA